MIDCKKAMLHFNKELKKETDRRLKELTERFEKRLKQAIKSGEKSLGFLIISTDQDIVEDFSTLLLDNNYTIFKTKMRNEETNLEIRGWAK